MNDTSATSQSGASLLPDGIDALTTIHLVIVALLAIAAVAIIVVGVRRKRLRTRAAREVTRNAQQAGIHAPTADDEQAAEPASSPPPVPPPSAPTPPTPALRDQAVPAPEPAPSPAPLDDEPIAAAAPMDASPAAEAAPTPAPAASADQPVTLLKGLGPKVAAALADRGITTVGQIAALDDAGAAALDAELGPFRGRMARDRWIEQARLLAAGDRAGFEAVFGKL